MGDVQQQARREQCRCEDITIGARNASEQEMKANACANCGGLLWDPAQEVQEGPGEQAAALTKAIEVALPYFGSGPPHSHYGHVKEDCALAHIDYFGGVSMAAGHLIEALSETTGEDRAEIYKRLVPNTPCDCRACAGPEAAQKARDEYAATLTEQHPPALTQGEKFEVREMKLERDAAQGRQGELLRAIEGHRDTLSANSMWEPLAEDTALYSVADTIRCESPLALTQQQPGETRYTLAEVRERLLGVDGLSEITIGSGLLQRADRPTMDQLRRGMSNAIDAAFTQQQSPTPDSETKEGERCGGSGEHDWDQPPPGGTWHCRRCGKTLSVHGEVPPPTNGCPDCETREAVPEAIKVRDEIWAVAKQLAPSDEAIRLKEIASRLPALEATWRKRLEEAVLSKEAMEAADRAYRANRGAINSVVQMRYAVVAAMKEVAG
jgi:hypothetical protein